MLVKTINSFMGVFSPHLINLQFFVQAHLLKVLYRHFLRIMTKRQEISNSVGNIYAVVAGYVFILELEICQIPYSSVLYAN